MKKQLLLLLLTLWSAVSVAQKIQNIRIKATGQIRAAKFNPAEYPLDEQGNLTEAAWTKLKAAIAAGQIQLIDPPGGSNVAPTVLNPFPDQVVTALGDQTLTIPANTFSDSDVLTWSAAQTSGQPLPNGVSFNGTTRALVVSGTFANGSVAIRLRATDPGGLSATDDFLLTVNRANSPPPSGTFAYQRGYVLGNSFTSHGAYTAINWFQNNGMAASSADKDFPARIKAHLRANGSPNFDLRASGYGSILEQQYANPGSINYSGITSEVQEKFGTEKVDLVIVRVGENFPSGTNQSAFNQTFDNAMAAIPKTDNVKVVVSDGVWLGHDEGHTMLQNWALARGYGFASEASIRETLVGGNPFSPYYATQYENAGVRRHYNDDGHQQIASLIIAKIPTGTNTGGGNTGGGTPGTPVLDAEFDQFAQMADTPWDAYDSRMFGNGAAGTGGRREKVPIGNKFILDNGTVHAEIWELFGGAVAHLSMGSGRDNMFNLYDLGRGTYMSMYGWPQPMPTPYKGNNWKHGPPWDGMSHNPIQGGDAFDYPSTMLKHVRSGNKVYTKIRMQQWAWHNQPTDVILEQITSIAANNAIEVRVRWTQNRTDEYKDVFGPSAQQQEYPCFMVNGRNRRVAYAVGADQFGGSQDIRVLAPNENPNQSWEGTPYYISEPWHAVEFKANQWVGLVADGFYRTSQNTVIIPGDGGMCEFCNEMTYLADHRQLHLDPQGSQKHKFYLVTGSNYTDIRQFASTLPRPTKPDWSFTKANGRMGWHSKACQDEREPFPSDGWKLTTARELQSDQTNAGVSKLFSPPIGYKTSDFNTLYIRYKYTGPQSSLQLTWLLNGQKDTGLQSWTPVQEANRFPRGDRGTSNRRTFPVIADNQWHTVVINLSGSDWNGIVQEFQIEGFGGTPASPDRIEFSYIGATNPGN